MSMAARHDPYAHPRDRGATPETESKARRYDVCLRLVEQGKLPRIALQAVQEIRDIREALDRSPVMARLWDEASVVPLRPREPIDRLSRTEERIYRTRYVPWLRELSCRPMTQRDLSEPVIAMVVHNASLRETEAAHNIRHGQALCYLRGALDIYARLAGWA